MYEKKKKIVIFILELRIALRVLKFRLYFLSKESSCQYQIREQKECNSSRLGRRCKLACAKSQTRINKIELKKKKKRGMPKCGTLIL